ncbi:MAG TPA: hypothetical protein VKY40_01590 [Halanaerobiales bacterium]|nr:hypothetical protein [Halanaerobiales bacterium]
MRDDCRDDRRFDDNFCCCKDEIAQLLDDLSDDVCPVEVLLAAGAPCCKLKGFICDIINNNCLLVLIEKRSNAKCFIPVDKIVAICKVCPGERHGPFTEEAPA